MRKTGFNVKKALLILVTMIVVIGTIKVINFQEQDTISINAIALDNYGYLESEEFELKAKEIGNDLYEIELPEIINEKKVAQSIQVVLESNVVKIKDNKIVLTKNQIENEKINLEVSYDVALLEKTNNETYKKNLLKDTTQEERNNIKIAENTELLYNKTLKHEDINSEKLVELSGFLPKDAKLQAEEVSRDKITEIFGNKKIDVAYDIKILVKGENGETVKVNPEDFGETCEVLIRDPKIQNDAKVYHVKEDNTYETVNVKQNTEENVSFDAHTFSIYAVGTEVDSEGIMNQDSVVGFSPASKTTSETSITVNIYSSSGYGRIIEYGWAEGSDEPGDTGTPDWEVLDVPAYDIEVTKTGTGIFYLHALTDAGNEGVGGPYILGKAPTIAFSPTYQETYTQKVTVDVTSDSVTGGISKIAWTTTTATPSSGNWNSVSAENTKSITKNTGTGTYYLHIGTEDGVTSYSGPYNLDNTGPAKPVISGDKRMDKYYT